MSERAAFEAWADKFGLLSQSHMCRIAWMAWCAATSAHSARDSEAMEELRRVLAGVGVVGQIDGHDVIRRLSVLDLVDRRIAAKEQQ
jgi:hypothetical protein